MGHTANYTDSTKHFILVHGSSHGAWCWFKIKPHLESSGHKVTVLDLAASGTNLKKIEDVDTLYHYSEPLLEVLGSLSPNEKVVLVGHSYGGLNIALAMEKFPSKIEVGVFLTAFVPDTEHKPSYVLEQYCEGTTASEWLDTSFSQCGNKTSMLFGPNFLSTKLYQLCSTQGEICVVVYPNGTPSEGSDGVEFNSSHRVPFMMWLVETLEDLKKTILWNLRLSENTLIPRMAYRFFVVLPDRSGCYRVFWLTNDEYVQAMFANHGTILKDQMMQIYVKLLDTWRTGFEAGT